MNDNRRLIWIVVALLIVLCLVLAAVAAGFAVISRPEVAQPDPGTAAAGTVAAELTVVALGLTPTPAAPAATETGIPPTATPTRASPTPTLSATPPPAPTLTPPAEDPRSGLGDPDWRDSFKSDANWTLFDVNSFRSEIVDNQYVMTYKTPNGRVSWELTWPKVRDMYLETTAVTTDPCVSGDRYGLIFRSPDPSQGYLFGITCDGRFFFSKWLGDEGGFLVPLTPSDAIQTGPNQRNRLGVWAEGQQFRLYANGVLLAEATDEAFKNEGAFGLLIGALNTENFTVKFDELAYWELQEE